MAYRFESKIALQFWAVTGLLILVAVAAAHDRQSTAVANAERLGRANEMLREIDRTLAFVSAAEAAQRGYLLTGRPSDRDEFDAACVDLDAHLGALDRLALDNPGTAAEVTGVRRPVSEALAELRESVALRDKGGPAAAAAASLPRTDRGKRLVGLVRDRVNRLRADQLGRVGGLTSRSGEDARSAMIVSAAGVVLTLAVLGYAFHLIARELASRRRVEADLSKLAAIVASTDDAVIGMTAGGTVTSWNAAAARLLGYSAPEAVGRNLGTFLPQDRRAETDALLSRVARGEGVGQLESVGLRKDGAAVDLELRVSPIRDEAGAVVGASAIARDVTARKRAESLLREKTGALETARARLASAAEFSAALNQPGVLETYRETLGCLARVARAPVAALYDVVDGEPPRARCAVGPDLLPLESAALQGDGLPATVARQGTTVELIGPFDDPALRTRFGLGEAALHSVLGWPVSFRGRTLGVLVTALAAPIDDERRVFVVTALEQLAVRMDGYQVEQQRLKLVGDLRAQSRALETARLEAERADRAKSEFLAAMSHELRTPMNSIMGFTARLIRKLGPTLGERELDALQTVDRNAKHLLGLINDILDLSKIEAGKMETRPERFDLAALAREAAGQSSPLFDDRPVELVLDLPAGSVTVEADPKLVRQVVLNLLSNAAKFTERGTVTVTAGPVRDAAVGDAVRLAVRDTGIGIKESDQARLFRRFSQLDGSPSRKVGGTGLGLALSEQMVRLHGGRIDVSSEFGRGSEFAVVLPRAALTGRAGPPASEPVPVPVPVPESSPPPADAGGPGRDGADPAVTILCVDDEPDALKYLQLTFEDAGYRVFTASCHDEAVDGARAHRPDLVCLDLSMPGKDGFEVLRTLRADPAMAVVPILVVSATSEESRALRAGARRCLPKPAEAGALVDAVHELLGVGAGDVLVVEDDPDTLRLVSRALAERGLRVRTAVDGREALGRVAASPPAAIVLDLMMPVMDGFTFLTHLGANPAWREIPVVVMSARSLEPTEARALGRSCVAVLAKGQGDPDRLVNAVLDAVRPRPSVMALEAAPA